MAGRRDGLLVNREGCEGREENMEIPVSGQFEKILIFNNLVFNREGREVGFL
jgi:hypothetical protein